MYPSDFPRRSRPYDPSSMKAHEWRQVGIYLFPIIVRCLPASGKGHEKSVFLAFSYLNRCMRLPEEEYQHVAEDMIDEALNILSDSYEKDLVRVAPDCNRSYCEDSFSGYSGSV